MRLDSQNYRKMLKESEGERKELQVHIEQTSVKITIDTKEHSTYQTQLIEENVSLKKNIEDMKKYQAKKEKEHLLEVEKLNQDHHREQEEKDKTHFQKVTNLNNEH